MIKVLLLLFKIKFNLLAIISFFLINVTFASDYEEIIKKFFSKKLENFEGPTVCDSMFYKDKNDFYYQIHIDSCFVIGKITGKQKKYQNINMKEKMQYIFLM